jgi:hypothetical protein
LSVEIEEGIHVVVTSGIPEAGHIELPAAAQTPERNYERKPEAESVKISLSSSIEEPPDFGKSLLARVIFN